MKLAVVGSRSLAVDLAPYIPAGVSEVISGGARGIDTCAADFAHSRGLKLTEFLPDYARFGHGAPLKRNELIVNAADLVLAIWDGQSKGTKFTIELARAAGKFIRIVIL